MVNYVSEWGDSRGWTTLENNQRYFWGSSMLFWWPDSRVLDRLILLTWSRGIRPTWVLLACIQRKWLGSTHTLRVEVFALVCNSNSGTISKDTNCLFIRFWGYSWFSFRNLLPCYEVCMCVQLLSRVQLFATTWTVAHQASRSMGFSRQGYWSDLPFPTAGDLLTQRLNLHLLHWQVDSLPLSYLGSPGRR